MFDSSSIANIMLEIGRSKKLSEYSNQLRLRHTFCTKKMNASCWQGDPPLTPTAAISFGGVE